MGKKIYICVKVWFQSIIIKDKLKQKHPGAQIKWFHAFDLVCLLTFNISFAVYD